MEISAFMQHSPGTATGVGLGTTLSSQVDELGSMATSLEYNIRW